MPVAAVTDDQRLVPPHSFPKATTTAASPRPESLGQSLIMDEWTIGGWYEGSGQYGPVFVRNDDTVYGWQAENDGTTFLPRVHAGRLEALQGEKLLWAQQLGGRPAGAPALAGGLVIQACRDGYVYAFHPKTGTLRWRFLAARADQRLVNSGQLESVWPCVGAVLHEGSIVVAAGISPELDGGGLVWGLDPESGAIRWKVPLVTDPVSGSGMDGRKRVSFHGHHTNGQGFVIQGIRVVEGMVAVGYRRTSNFGSHGSNFWAWVGIDPKKNEPLDPVERWLKGIQCWHENDLGVLTPQKAAGPNYRSNK
jgi:hypothetical protein